MSVPGIDGHAGTRALLQAQADAAAAKAATASPAPEAAPAGHATFHQVLAQTGPGPEVLAVATERQRCAAIVRVEAAYQTTVAQSRATQSIGPAHALVADVLARLLVMIESGVAV